MSFHRSALVQNWFQHHPQFTVLYLPPYSPFLNPIKGFFPGMAVEGLRSPAPGSGIPHWKLSWIQNFLLVWYIFSFQCSAHDCSCMKTGTCFVVILHVDMLTDLGIWREINYNFISLRHWSCVVFGEFIVYLHFLCVFHFTQYSNHWEVQLLKARLSRKIVWAVATSEGLHECVCVMYHFYRG